MQINALNLNDLWAWAYANPQLNKLKTFNFLANEGGKLAAENPDTGSQNSVPWEAVVRNIFREEDRNNNSELHRTLEAFAKRIEHQSETENIRDKTISGLRVEIAELKPRFSQLPQD